MKIALKLSLGSAFIGLAAGCASVNSGIQSMTDKLEASNASRIATNMAAYPDPSLRAAYVLDNGRPVPTFTCAPCSLDVKAPTDRFDFLMIDRKAAPVNDAHELAVNNARRPIETTDVGQAFVRVAKSRGNTVAVYGPPVNDAILRGVQVRQFFDPKRSYPTDLSACMVELDPRGAFVSILAVRHTLSQGAIESDFPGSKDVFVDERIFLFPATTARYVQERIAVGFTENYRVR